MDVVIPFTHSNWHNNELRFALRGLVKHFKDLGQIWIIGDNPVIIRNVNFIQTDNIDEGEAWKHRNIHRNIMEACKRSEISDDFLFVNDDHFMTADFSTIPYYCNDTFQAECNRMDAYGLSARNTAAVLRAPYWEANFDVHCPIIYNKNLYQNTVGKLDWKIKGGYNIKTAYCALNKIKGVPVKDLKIKGGQPIDIAGRKWFSISDDATGPEMLRLLETLYPQKSKYEQ